MCGRYTLRRAETAVERITGSPFPWDARYNVCPSQEMPVVVLDDGRPAVRPMAWGYVPFYERKKEKPRALINARSETAPTKAPFKRGARQNRCLVPADGFFEWRRDESGKTPFFIRIQDDEPFALEAYPISTIVNSPQNDLPECIEPVGA